VVHQSTGNVDNAVPSTRLDRDISVPHAAAQVALCKIAERASKAIYIHSHMDEENFEQFALPRADVADALDYMLPSSSVQMLAVNGKPSGIQLPSSVELAVSDTEPGVKGDTVSNVTKAATLETGAVVQVPLFVNVGDRVKVDPREARYISRA
jgi:hypothetical protein